MAWQIEVAELMRVCAILCVVGGMLNLFRCRETAFIGTARWLAVGVIAAFVPLHGGLYIASVDGVNLPPKRAELISACSVLVIALSQCWFLLHVKSRMRRAMGPAMRRRFNREDQRLFETKRSLELVEEIAHVGYWRYDLANQRLTWSDEIYRIHGVEKPGYTPSLDAAIHAYHKDDQEIFVRAFWDAALHKTSFDISARLVRAGGEVRHVRSCGVAELDDEGDVMSVFSAFIDITEQKCAEDALLKAKMIAEKTNEALKAIALLDSLTGLPNRRHFDAALEVEFKRAIRDSAMLGVIMIDLDHFKGFNDLYGHPAGDDCLRRVACAIRSVLLRPGDLVARYGGEEMIVLLPGTDEDGAGVVASVLAEAVRALALEHRGTPARIVTISCGVAVFDPLRGACQPLTLVERADRALYEAKLTGRNRVVRHIASDAAD